MSEQITQAPDPDVSENNRANYSRYKNRVADAERRRAWMADKSFKTTIKKAIFETGNYAIGNPGLTKEITVRELGAPQDELERSSEYFKQNEEAVVEDAIHDFSNDSANAGKVLNLPGSGIAEAADRVQTIVEQEQPKHN